MSDRSNYDPNKYKKLREKESDEFEFIDESDENFTPTLTPAREKKIQSTKKFNDRSKTANLHKNENEDTVNDEEGSDVERSEPLIDFYLRMKKNFNEINQKKGDVAIGKSSYANSTLKSISIIHTHMLTSWTIPKQFAHSSDNRIAAFLKKNGIQVDGLDLPPPIKSFTQLKIPKAIIDFLLKNKISKPTPIQSQSLPIIFSGRDIVATSFAGSGKTLCYILPLLCFAMQQQKQLKIKFGEGPLFLILTPSRELAEQIFQIIQEYITLVKVTIGIELMACLAIGGISLNMQLDSIRQGIHILVATPGRLNHLLSLSKGINLLMCQVFCIDGADALSDRFFVEDLDKILLKMSEIHQTLLFSTTQLTQIPYFLLKSLCNSPAVVSVTNVNTPKLIQQFALIENQNKLPILLEILQKTPPPVLIFTFLKEDVDVITEYLLLKGISAVSLHADKLQNERSNSLMLFNSGKKDVLVATDIASRGLDFKKIEHVINYELPEEFDSYVSRIGRTGRNCKGLSTTLIDKGSNIITLIEVKKYLIECKQEIPSFMENIKTAE